MTADPKEKILERILKLFRLGDKGSNTTEAEMMLAISKARELMVKHAISMAEVEGRLTPEKAANLKWKIKTQPAYVRKGKLAYYDHAVALCVQYLTDTKCIITTNFLWNTQSMVFIGEEADVELASALFILLLEHVRAASRSTYGTGWSKRHTSYALGYGTRMAIRAEQLKVAMSDAEAKTMALVLHSKQTAISQFMAAIKVNPGENHKFDHDEDWHRGYHDGEHVSLQSENIIGGTIRSRNATARKK